MQRPGQAAAGSRPTHVVLTPPSYKRTLWLNLPPASAAGQLGVMSYITSNLQRQWHERLGVLAEEPGAAAFETAGALAVRTVRAGGIGQPAPRLPRAATRTAGLTSTRGSLTENIALRLSF